MLATPSTASETHASAKVVNAPPRGEVTVVIAAWRAAGTIGRAVASALAQPEAAEVVVVDDASGDDGATVAAAQAADDGTNRLKIIALDRNGGPSRARNAAIDASYAPWIAILDSDDFLEAGRLTALLAIAHGGYDLIADDLLQTLEGQTAADGKPMWFREDRTPIDIDFSFFVESNIARPTRYRRELGFLKPLMRRAFLDRNHLSYNESMRLGEDFDLYARALEHGARMRLVPWTGYVSVMRQGGLSVDHDRADLVALAAADDRLLASDKLKPAEKFLVQDHRFRIESRIVWIDFMAVLKTGHVFRAASIMLRDPRQAPYVLRGLWTIVVRRMTGAKTS